MQTDQLLEFFSALTCIWSIWLNTRRKILGWPIGLISVLLATRVYFSSGLFAECTLQAFYFLSGIYGWWKWSKAGKNEDQQSVRIGNLPAGGIFSGLLAALLCSGLIWYFLLQFPDARNPLPDALLTGFSLLAQLWLAWRKIENWLLWIVINTGSVFLYLQRELWFFSILYFLLLLLAFRGYFSWKKQPETCFGK